MENEKFFEIKDLVVKFGPPKRRNAVLKGINLSVPKGKVLGLVRSAAVSALTDRSC